MLEKDAGVDGELKILNVAGIRDCQRACQYDGRRRRQKSSRRCPELGLFVTINQRP
ncbi:MAG: hypothetical protein MZV70_77325 [Desulfobacterales bacterium]|nr:hypothetical protein [Desulfobacterales bacterium]